jgi:hypothetical protein
MDLKLGLDAGVQVAQKGDEVFGSMLFLGVGDDFSGGTVERSEKVERAMAEIVVRLPFRLPEVHGQDRLRSLEGLDLRLLIKRKNHCVVGRVHVEPDDVTNLLDE